MSPADSSLDVKGQVLRTVLCSYRGRVAADIRHWYLPKDGDRLAPGKRGISIPAAHLPWLIEALQALVDHMVRDGFLELGPDALHVRLHPEVYPKNW